MFSLHKCVFTMLVVCVHWYSACTRTHTRARAHAYPLFSCCIETRELTQDGHCGGAEPQGQLGLHKKHVTRRPIYISLYTFSMTATQFPFPIGERLTVRQRLKCNLCNPKSLSQPNQECCLIVLSFFLSFFSLSFFSFKFAHYSINQIH